MSVECLRVSLLLGLVYLISDSGLQKNLIGLQRMPATAGKLSNGQAFKPGIQESRKGIAEIEGKATRVGASERSRGDASDIDGQNREVEMGGST